MASTNERGFTLVEVLIAMVILTVALVALAEMTRRPLNELTVADLRGIDPAFSPDVRHVFDLKKAMARRTLVGAPGPREVQRQLARWRNLLDL